MASEGSERRQRARPALSLRPPQPLPTPPADPAALSTADLETRMLRLETALERMSHGVCFFDGQQRLILANQRYAELYDLAPESIRPGMMLREVIDLRFQAGSFPEMTPEEYWVWRKEVATRNEPSESVVEMRNGRTIVIKHQPMPDGGWVATHEDITEQQRSAARIAHMAHHDALTGLANRVLFRQALEDACMPGAAEAGPALLCIDLDRFKHVNDTLGHLHGDLLLRAVAGRLQSLAVEGDTIARLGGDEFAIIRRRSGASDAADLARSIIDALGQCFELDGNRANIGASVGIALASGDGPGPDALLHDADVALYQAKAAGRGSYRFFEAETNLRMQVRHSLEHDLHRALDEGALELHYQPLVAVPDRQILGFEALLRWRHPERGMIMPQTFIPLAEAAGLIVPIGDWAIRTACAELASLPGRPKLSVNVSPLQLTARFPASVAAALKAAGLEPARLELEITETAMLRETEATLTVLHGLRNLGVGIAMDDFGTGFSSLSALKRFPFTRVKIDQVFVRNLGEVPESASLLRAIVELCKVLRMATTTEGIETEEQFAAVAASGSTEAQGYLFGRPMPIRQATLLLERDDLRPTGRKL
ncbi:EAL domain-containing protein [Roseomonas hellenica]|uniref:EAL domain-containing protein n=1 Tax=Plastoroseomonas hellenica TaxID=2687306 RepID=A0ABS5EV64_9PROT|nr:EAL domain-containing protein [Plastoroseomonas hellenica]MBR0664174.1 EAL domain-containing protein [Plastoroseomonas hellenica]